MSRELSSLRALALDDEAILTGMVVLFSQAKIYQLEHYESSIDFSPFFDLSSPNRENLLYMCDSIELERRMLALNTAKVISSSVDVTIDDFTIKDDCTKIEAYELYCYIRPETPDFDAKTGVRYYYTFEKQDGVWYIIDLYTDSSFDCVMRETGINIDDYVEKAGLPCASDSYAAYLGSVAVPTSSQSGWTYRALDTDKVAIYANTYATDYNDLFFNYKSQDLGDCQNYASQAIWYGLGGDNTAASITEAAWPMIDDGTDGRGWFHLTKWIRDESGHWTSVIAFADYVANGGTQIRGLTGTVTSGIANASYGDIIQVGNAAHDGYYHSFIVVAHSGTAGSRTASNLWVAGHTADMSYKPFSEVYSSANYYRTIHITGLWDVS